MCVCVFNSFLLLYFIFTYLHTCVPKSMSSITVTVFENGIGDPSSNPQQGYLCFTLQAKA